MLTCIARRALRSPSSRAGLALALAVRAGAAVAAPRSFAARAAAARPRARAAAAKKPAGRKAAAAAGKKKPAGKKKKRAGKKAAPKKKKKRAPMTAEEKAKARLRELRAMALLKGPKQKPVNGWSIYVAGHLPGGTASFQDKIRKVKADFDALPAPEKQRLETQAQQNRASNQCALQEWVKSQPYEAIYMANLARRALSRQPGKKRLSLIRDERQPKRASNGFNQYIKARCREMPEGAASQDVFCSAAAAWRSMSDADKKPYKDSGAAEARRASERFKAAREAGQAYWRARKAAASASRASPSLRKASSPASS